MCFTLSQNIFSKNLQNKKKIVESSKTEAM